MGGGRGDKTHWRRNPCLVIENHPTSNHASRNVTATEERVCSCRPRGALTYLSPTAGGLPSLTSASRGSWVPHSPLFAFCSLPPLQQRRADRARSRAPRAGSRSPRRGCLEEEREDAALAAAVVVLMRLLWLRNSAAAPSRLNSRPAAASGPPSARGRAARPSRGEGLARRPRPCRPVRAPPRPAAAPAPRAAGSPERAPRPAARGSRSLRSAPRVRVCGRARRGARSQLRPSAASQRRALGG